MVRSPSSPTTSRRITSLLSFAYKFEKESENITLSAPIRNGYNFIGWTGSNGTTPGSVTISTGTYGDKTYTANFELAGYTISYDLAGGTLSTANPTTYTIEDTITLNEPTKDGYNFIGWTGTDLTAPTKTVTFSNKISYKLSLHKKSQ